MNKLNKKIVSLVVTVMMLASAFLIPGVFNFSRVVAEEATLELKVNIGNNNNLIASFRPSSQWVEAESNGVVTLTNIVTGVVVEFSNFDIKSGNDDSVFDIKITGDDVIRVNATFSQSQGQGGDRETVTFENGVVKTITISNKLNFINFDIVVTVEDDQEPEPPTVEYTISYHIFEGDDFNTVSTKTFTVEEGMGNPFEPETREGFQFMGWFMENTFETLVDFDYLFDPETPSYDVFGFYRVVDNEEPQPDTFTLTYVTNAESLSFDDVIFEEGDTITPEAPSLEGFTFGGWFIDNGFTELFNDFGSMPGNDVTVYGQWIEVVDDEPQPDLYNVIYFVWNDELGEFEEVNRDAYEEGQSIVRFDVDGRDGFIFDGWYTMAQPIFTLNVENMDNQDFVELPILIDDRMNLIPFDFDGAVMGTSDIELYGRFVQVVAPIEFVIDFIIVGETNELLESRTFDFEEGFGEIPAPTQEGFTFTGWFTNEELTNPADFDTLLNAEVLEYTVYGSWVMNEDEEDEIIDDEVDEDDEGDVDGDEDEDDETVEEETTEEETTEEETTEEVTVVEDDGDVLGDSDEFVEEEERTSEEVDDDDKGEVLGDSDQLPEMSDTNYATIALFFLIIGLLTLVATKPEEEVI